MSEEKASRKSNEEKLAILREAKDRGITATCEKYGIYPATYYNWKRKFEEMGELGLHHGMNPSHIKEIRRLEKENQRLRNILIEKELEANLKDELLKKKYPERYSKKSR